MYAHELLVINQRLFIFEILVVAGCFIAMKWGGGWIDGLYINMLVPNYV
jgi:hypothetical protein